MMLRGGVAQQPDIQRIVGVGILIGRREALDHESLIGWMLRQLDYQANRHPHPGAIPGV